MDATLDVIFAMVFVLAVMVVSRLDSTLLWLSLLWGMVAWFYLCHGK